MSSSTDDSGAALRRSLCWLLIMVGLGVVIGRIMAVDAVDRRLLPDPTLKKKLSEKSEELKKQGLSEAEVERVLDREKAALQISLGIRRPFLSANDRSRWCTVRALVDPEMRVDGARYSIDKVIQQPGWDTIDMVRSTRDGHLYSSKPPLLPTIMAGEYWVIRQVTGMTLGENPYEVGRIILLTINGGCLLLYFWAVARMVERLGASDWGRLFVMAVAVFGTFVTTFAVVINNHLVAAACAAVLLEYFSRIWFDGDRRIWTFVVAGFFSAMLAANELPATALSAAISLAVLWKAPRQTLQAYLAPALLVTIAFFATNYVAVGSLKPAYMHRSGDDNWYDYKYERGGRTIESYWNHRAGIDRGEPSASRYTLHVLVGHHGIFSLTPVWILSLAGALHWLFRSRDRKLHGLVAIVGLVTAVCMAFYVWWPTVDRNYGGTATGFRWVLWMAPMWLAMMLPAVDVIGQRRALRVIALVLLAISVVSACYATWNPWTHPWLMDYMNYMGWL